MTVAAPVSQEGGWGSSVHAAGLLRLYPGGFFPKGALSRLAATLHRIAFHRLFCRSAGTLPDERAEQQEAGDCSAQAYSKGCEARCHACILQPPSAVASGMWTR